MDVASHYVVGEVRLQNNVLGVHMNLEKRNGKRGPVRKIHPTWSPKKVVERQADTEVTQRGRVMETDVLDKETKVGKKGQWKFKKISTVFSARDQKLPQSQSPFQEGPAEGTVASFCPRVRAGTGVNTWST